MSKPLPKLAPKTIVVVVPASPVLLCWDGVVVRYMARGDQRGKYEVAPVAGGPTRFVAREEIEIAPETWA